MIDCDSNDKRYKAKLHRKIHQTKKKVKPKLTSEENGWHKLNYANTLNLSSKEINENIVRVDRNILTAQEFREKFEKTSTPVIILNDQKYWLAHKKWKLSRLKLKYRNQLFRCGDDENGFSVKIKLKYFIDYMLCNTDDAPLYIFDGSIKNNTKKSRLLEDYIISDYFNEDLFSILGDEKRPPFRWFVMGPPRSGTNIHIDPLGTSAWNALIHGYKRWCLFPPCTPKFLIKPILDDKWKNLSEAVVWFNVMYKRMLQSDWPTEYAMIEAIQRPGETIFIPSGWWHVVLNLTNTVAITQNFCSTINFPIVWYKTVRHRKSLSKLWYQKLSKHHSDLCKIADGISITEPLKNYYSSTSSSSSSSSIKSSDTASNSQYITPNEPFTMNFEKLVIQTDGDKVFLSME